MSKYDALWHYIANCGRDNLTLRFDEIEKIAGIPIDHAFLRYKNELTDYGYAVGNISMKAQTVSFERLTQRDTLILYVHGKGGSAAEAAHYAPLFPNDAVIGLDYRAETPWEAQMEFPAAFRSLSAPYRRVVLIANSIGAFFSMCALPQKKIERSYFISPIVDMERLILDMLCRAGASEDALRERGTLETAFGEALSWDYLCFVRAHPMDWRVPTGILYGAQDGLTARETITAFADAHHAGLTIMEDGEHWFHTAEQLRFLDDWFIRCECSARNSKK